MILWEVKVKPRLMLEAKFGDKYIIWNLFVKIRTVMTKAVKKPPIDREKKKLNQKLTMKEGNEI